MKSLVLWSSRTGNTKAVAEAIFEALPGEKEIMEEGREGNDLSSYDLVFVGFWGYRRGADPLAQRRFLPFSENMWRSMRPPVPGLTRRRPRCIWQMPPLFFPQMPPVLAPSSVRDA